MKSLFFLFIIILGMALVPSPCSGANYTVTTTNDTGPGSLRAVLTQANRVTGPHTVTFATSGHFSGGGSISLASSLPQIMQSVSLVGWRSAGATNNSIAVRGSPFMFANGTSNSLQQLNIYDSVRNGSIIAITGCVITNGGIQSTGVLQVTSSSILSSPAAGIWNSGNATLDRVIVSHCLNGGIYNEGTMSAGGSTISNNTSTNHGGGIYSVGAIQTLGCQVVGNVALTGNGGGVFTTGRASLIETSIRSNITQLGLGGGIYAEGNLVMAQSLIAQNIAQGAAAIDGGGGGAGVGGGMYLKSATAILTNITIFGNHANGGSGGSGLGGNGAGLSGGAGGQRGRPGKNFSFDPDIRSQLQEAAGGQGGTGGTGGFASGGGPGGPGGVGGFDSFRVGLRGSPGPTGPGGGGGFGGGGGAGSPGGTGGSFGGIGATTGGGGAGIGSALFVESGDLALVNCTVASNQASGGTPGGHGVASVFNLSGNVSLLNTLIAENVTATVDAPDVYGTFQSMGYNFIGNSTGSSGWDPVTDYQNAIPLSLGPLQNNGGPTFTCALLQDSLGILTGTSVGAPAADQRGVTRPIGKCDIGAFQYTTLVPTQITWTNPAPIIYSTALNTAQLNASANVGGTFTYIPPAGTLLNAGSNQVLTAIFTPADPSSYLGASNTVLITVLKTNQLITFPLIPAQTLNAVPIVLSASASSGLPVSYTLMSGSPLLAGNLLSVGSTPGQVVVRASQPGNTNFLPAPIVDQSFLVVSGSKPSMTTQPTNQTVDLGGNAQFSVAATTSPLTYQWQFQSLDLPGATNQTLSLLRVKENRAGPYRVIVSNPIGSVTSAVAVLTVKVPPGISGILVQPASISARVGETATFNVVATGDATLHYQWYRGMSGQTGNSVGTDSPRYITGALTETSSYWVSVSNALGMVDSATATVTVSPATAARLNLTRMSGMAVVSVDGPVGTQYVLQYSPDLHGTNWTTLLDYTQNVNPFIYIDSGSIGVPFRVYRAKTH